MILVKKLQTKVRLPAGVYYIGDPCYVFNDKDWDEIWSNRNLDEPQVELFGKKVFVAPTRWGDGVYTDNLGNVYTVDAGLLGILPVCLVDRAELRTSTTYGWHFVKFDKPFTAELKDKGIFKFGHIVIDTTGN
jgi:hypothetical protein